MIFIIVLLVLSVVTKKAFQYLPFLIITSLMFFLLVKSDLLPLLLKLIGFVTFVIIIAIIIFWRIFKKSVRTYYSYEFHESEEQRNNSSPKRPINPTFNAYKILNIPTNSSKEDVKRAYRELVKQHHPDKFVNANDQEKEFHEKKLKEINDAYAYITKRQE